MLLVLGIGDGGEVIAVAGRSTAIFGWAGSFSFKAQRGFRLRVSGRKTKGLRA